MRRWKLPQRNQRWMKFFMQLPKRKLLQICLLQRLKQLHLPLDMTFSQQRTKVVSCTDCAEQYVLWRCPVFRGKTWTQRAKVVADNKLCFLWLNGQHSFRQCSNHPSAPQKVVQALTTSCYTEPREVSHLQHYVERTIRQKIRTYRWKKSREKAQALFPKAMLEVCYKFWKLSCNHRQEPKPYLLHVTLTAVTHGFQKN